jgi:AraC-like DNA-binding protein
MPTPPGQGEPKNLLLVERDGEVERRRLPPSWPLLLAPLESSVIRLESGRAEAMPLDRASIALVPAGAAYRARVVSPVTTVVIWSISPEMRAMACREYQGHVEEARFQSLLATARILPRTRWVDEIIHRYVFEREVCAKHDSPAAVFLETEIAKEIYFLCKEREEEKTRASVVHEESDLILRARAHIDEKLSSPLDVADLAAHCHTSESTLVRAFRRELGQTPMGYTRERRLDRALLLLQSGRYRVGEVAERVGYTNFAAFTSAFHKRFGAPPSVLRAEGGSLGILPPEGGAPRVKRR